MTEKTLLNYGTETEPDWRDAESWIWPAKSGVCANCTALTETPIHLAQEDARGDVAGRIHDFCSHKCLKQWLKIDAPSR